MQVVFFCGECEEEYESLTSAVEHINETWPHHHVEPLIKPEENK